MQDRRFDVDVDQDLLESFAESLSSMDYTTLCIMNHKSREENDKHVPVLHNYDVFYPDDINLLFHGNSLDNIERMHWHYIDGSNESLRNLYDANIQPPSQLMIPTTQQSQQVITTTTTKSSTGKIASARIPSAAAKQRRRERNKVLARRTRVKKKVEMETLRDSVVALMKENDKIRSLILEKLPSEIATKSLESSSYQLPENIVHLIEQWKSSEERHLCNEMKARQSCYCVVSTSMSDDYPIVFASEAFYDLTGYSKEQIIGRNCRLLQGPDTDKNEIKKLKDALSRKEDISTILLNYHKDGSTFLNRLEITHLKDINGETPFIVGLQYKLTKDQQLYFNELNLTMTESVNNIDDDHSTNAAIVATVDTATTTTVAVIENCLKRRSSVAADGTSSDNGCSGSVNTKNIKTKIKLINLNTNASKSSGSTNNSLNGCSSSRSNNNNNVNTTTSKINKNPCFRRISGTTSHTDSSSDTANYNKITKQLQQQQSSTSKFKVTNTNKSSNCSNNSSSTANKSTSNESNSGINSIDGSSHCDDGGMNSHSDEGTGDECCGEGKKGSETRGGVSACSNIIMSGGSNGGAIEKNNKSRKGQLGRGGGGHSSECDGYSDDRGGSSCYGREGGDSSSNNYSGREDDHCCTCSYGTTADNYDFEHSSSMMLDDTTNLFKII